jgi:hypothetical protein
MSRSVVEETHPRMRRTWRRDADLLHEHQRTPSLGCGDCIEKPTCGGLHVAHALFDCFDHCCRNPSKCNYVCRLSPSFARRVWEIDGFALDNVPRTRTLPTPQLPNLIPIIYHRSRRSTPFASAAACVSLYQLLSRNGRVKFRTPGELRSAFMIASHVPVVLTGTAKDAPIERWWGHAERRRRLVAQIANLNVALVTTPNYSLFTDQTRWTDLHAMKRIAITHEEFQSAGILTALHINGRTDRDFERWAEYLSHRPEITHIAYEFGTGAGWLTRRPWHLEQLYRVAELVPRPLHLVVRGGQSTGVTVGVKAYLNAAFASIIALDTTVFVKSVHFQRAKLTAENDIAWEPPPPDASQSVEELLRHNYAVRMQADAGAYLVIYSSIAWRNQMDALYPLTW